MVIVITGIIAAVVAVFIRAPVEGYLDAAARAELTDVADVALRRMARDIRLALPNSVRISVDGQYLELLLTRTGGRYLAEEDELGGRFLRFDAVVDCVGTPDDCRFDVIGAMPTGSQAIVPNSDFIVVSNHGHEPEFIPANAYAGGNLALVTAINGNTVTMATNPFAIQNPPMRSQSHRFQVVTTPVTYFCNGAANGAGSLTRYWGYPIQAAQPINSAAAPLSSAGTSTALLATGVTGCTFSYENLANVHSGLIGLTIQLEVPNSGSGAVTLSHQVHVDNTP